MYRILFGCVLMGLLALPVNAAEVSENETVAYVSEAVTDGTEAPTQSVENTPVAQSGGSALSGGYYFVCSCALGDALKFYVPIEWAHDAFALNESGAPVNMSTSTCYAYCEAFPEYTFTCSRFGTFNYRMTNSTTTALEITSISDTNISFLEDEAVRPSDSELLLLIAGMIFLFGAVFMILRR